MNDDELLFLSELEQVFIKEETWKVLIVDDDREVHSLSKIALSNFSFLGKNLDLFSAYNEDDTLHLLKNHEFAVVFLDVIMENDDSGFKIVNHIRNVLHDQYIQIIIRTGEANSLSEQAIFSQYHINSYCEKTELTRDKLFSHLHAALSHFHQFKELLQEQNKLSNNVSRDYLTGAYNRYKMEEEVNRLVAHSDRYNESFGIIMFDIDLFKNINDRYGHQTGDRLLIQLVNFVEKNIRESDILIRWGGEEFIILLPLLSLDETRYKADELRKMIEAEDFNIPQSITCSFGVNKYSKDDTKEKLLKELDKALYRAKSNGRNRVEQATKGENNVRG